MNMNTLLLILTPLLPLLLALPALRPRIIWPCHFALLPALILASLPTDVSIELPWLLLGGGLGADATSRLFLAMAVLLWGSAAALLPVAKDDRLTTFLLLTLTGNLGVILATDLVVFFACLVLMGYAFYGLLITAGDEGIRRAARRYLLVLILSDLLLFEALLIAAAMTETLGFEAVRQAIAQSPSSAWYLAMVLAGFAARAAIWPLHVWLPLLVASSRPALAMLLGGVPVAIALLGIVRWLPLGEITSPNIGLVIQGVGVVAMLYAILVGIKRGQLAMLPVYATLFATGVFAAALGVGLSDPAAWHRYQHLIDDFIISLGVGVAVLTAIIHWRHMKPPFLAAPMKSVDDTDAWFDRWTRMIIQWVTKVGFNTLPRLCDAWWAKVDRFKQPHAWQRALDTGECYLRRWRYATALFLLLGIVITLIEVLVGTE